MTTILQKIETSGNGLMKNRQCFVTIEPSNLGVIRFFVGDEKPFEACIENVLDTNHCILMGANRAKTMLSEHFMAACAICGIDSIDVHLSSMEFPILDGSAKTWLDLFKTAGVEEASPRYYTVSEPVYYLNGKTHMVILPDNELNISYAINYDHPDLTTKWVSYSQVEKPNWITNFKGKNTQNLDEIIEARTFGFLKELKKIQLFGFAKGVTYENTVGLNDDGYTTELRSEMEPAKHKILDLIGDLYLTGVNPLNLKAQIIVKEAGHAVHCKVAKILKDKLVECK